MRDFASLEQLAAMRVSVSLILYFLKKVALTTVKRRYMGVPLVPGQKERSGGVLGGRKMLESKINLTHRLKREGRIFPTLN